VAGAGFTVDPGTATLNVTPGHPQWVKVTYRPPANAARTAGSATVSTNDASRKPVIVRLNGVRTR
jgi:hypothetical protein